MTSKSKSGHAPRSPAPQETTQHRSDPDIEYCDEKGVREKKFASSSKTENKKFIEGFIKSLLSCKGIATSIKTMDMLRVFYIAKKIFTDQGRLVEVEPPIRVLGDLHGQYPDLMRLMDMCGFPPDANYMFLGDYVDRGNFSLDIFLLLLAFKIRWPLNFFMLRGNHEHRRTNELFGFREEIFRRRAFSPDVVWEECNDMMDHMPLTGLIGGRILCMHGGLSPHLKSLDDLRKIPIPFTTDTIDCLGCDIMWADPSSVPGFTKNQRGASVCFGEDVVKEMCRRLGIDLVIRGHQVVQDGYEFFADKKLVTVFSAPHYCGTFNNCAAACKISAGLEVSFEILKPELVDNHYDREQEPTDMTEPMSDTKN